MGSTGPAPEWNSREGPQYTHALVIRQIGLVSPTVRVIPDVRVSLTETEKRNGCETRFQEWLQLRQCVATFLERQGNGLTPLPM